MNKNILIGGIVLILIVVGVIFFAGQKSSPEKSNNPVTQQQTSNDEGKVVEGFNGKVLAGTSSPYLDFKKADYDKALNSGKIIVLDFYANWCPICRGEAPYLKTGFDSLTTDKIIGFRVNFKDSDTDEDEKSLAAQFNIPYQHTKVILKNGKEFSRSLDSWTKETFDSEIAKALQ